MATDGLRVEQTRRTRTDRAETDSGSEAVLELDEISKRYGDERAVSELSLSVREGELLTLLGPSGCGKTTTLRLIAGLERPDDGEIRVGDETVADSMASVEPEGRDIGIVFQSFALFPHMSAAENVAFGLADRTEAERDERVGELLDLVGLADHADSKPSELSGGQKQRIALARSLAPEPEILLLDEPFSNLDVDLRVEMREEVRRILKEAGVTGISVTHDQEEAMSISDRVAVMNEGTVMQVGRPEDVFQHPESRFVAGFLGHASFLSGYVSDDVVETALGTVGRDRIHGLAPEYDRTRIDVLVRPDDVLVRPADESEEREGSQADGRVTYRRYLGPTVLYRVELENGDVVEAMHNHAERVSLDTPVTVELAAAHDLAWFPTEDH
ncbi:ABC transporter ATP-binding protein [Halalkalicoccus sp. NIPERK01]|uniref:ABC transporter ATP-binding protein n=1 Tax=Halalkalicoccus sp. NIPERK01 TaxID=3053469 RepID=UPI00256EA980|nr:ABC transporter ATP-binding protein [Halalkalicoccus sp. NIPERK01]MDL5360779.1 ABC transporter ATP-binding protein [Halalkalicoccus sp. NIPERK01]